MEKELLPLKTKRAGGKQAMIFPDFGWGTDTYRE